MKRKIIFLMIFSVGLVCSFCNIGAKEVKANNCEVHTNYYFLLSAQTKSNLLNDMDANGLNTKTHEKTFVLGIPNDILDDGVTEISATSTDDGPNSMSLRTFYEIYYEMFDDKEYDTNGLEHYIWSSNWSNVETGEGGDNRNMPSSFSAFQDVVIFADDVDADISVEAADEDGVTLLVERTWKQDDVDAIDIGDDDMIFSPSVYYFQYEVCDNTEFKTVAHFIDNDTNNEIDTVTVDSGLFDGDSYDEYSCPASVSDKNGNKYTLDSSKKTTYNSGVIDGEDVNFDCYYTKDAKKVMLTINYGTNSSCTGTAIKNPTNAEYKEGESLKISIPSISGYEFSDIGALSHTFSYKLKDNNLIFTMPSKNASVCLVYVKNPQTGAGWIYFTFIIGIAALVYGGWYFMKYYKNQNNEI